LNRAEKGKRGIFIVVSAPSGAGKTSICKEVLRMYPEIVYSISYTTRPPRTGEVDGKDYFFITEKEFRQRIETGEFAEWTEKFGYLYGTSKKTMRDFLDRGYDLMLDIDPAGAKSLKKNFSGGIFVFILPPSMEELEKRLRRRGSEKPEILEKRLEKSIDEIKEIFWYDYIILNDRIQAAIDRLRSIYIAEKTRREQMIDDVNRLFHLEVKD